ncbi:LysR family transcriptional regulator [Fulvivirga lutimaris]|uniref:LysR family transcriptional regulator n=1 Tax=Fulvivirga lutimaris TaxID=1819566 RepID=UPI0012BC2CF5|nr:LysR substrate-binding domain-containing protein [Fulvivirga lutimaris]MTI39447.1 LysR family transcriptional regulator [Fulvivirga lutimaris]
MTLQQLQYALALQRHKSFRIAAQKLNLSQPGLSLQIGKLEKEIGLLLFDRSKSPINPTPEGSKFLAKAHEIIVSTDELQEFANNMSDTLSGKISLGIIPTLAPFLVPLFADSFQQTHSDIALDINEMTTELVVRGVLNGDLDAGIISTPIQAFGLLSQPLFYEKFFFYKSGDTENSKISLSSIDYSKLWLLNEGNCFRDQINNFCNLSEIRKNKKFIYRSNSIDALIRIVDVKGGMTILPELTTLSLNEHQEENICQIDSKNPKAREIGLITRTRNNKENMLNELCSHIKSNIPKAMLTNTGLDVVDPNIQME